MHGAVYIQSPVTPVFTEKRRTEFGTIKNFNFQKTIDAHHPLVVQTGKWVNRVLKVFSLTES